MLVNPLKKGLSRESVYAQIYAHSAATPNSQWLSSMIASWCVGSGSLPDYLGLEPIHFKKLLKMHYSQAGIPHQAISNIKPDFARMLEKDDLIRLLRQYARAECPESEWIIAIIVAGCLGSDHLWQDLGLWSRTQLSEMMHYNFPELAGKNNKDMKWKKFIYKQLCEAEGLYLCRAPSCEVCSDYQNCFGPEE